MNKYKITVTLSSEGSDDLTFHLEPGDQVDLDFLGIVKFIEPKLAEAQRIVDRVNQERVQAAINYIGGKQ